MSLPVTEAELIRLSAAYMKSAVSNYDMPLFFPLSTHMPRSPPHWQGDNNTLALPSEVKLSTNHQYLLNFWYPQDIFAFLVWLALYPPNVSKLMQPGIRGRPLDFKGRNIEFKFGICDIRSHITV